MEAKVDISIPALVLWLPASFGTHVALHEASHAGAASLLGGTEIRLRMFPAPGRIATVDYELPVVGGQRGHAIVAAAPLVLEAVWFLAAVAVLSFADLPTWARTVLLIEAVMAMSDIAAWLALAWAPDKGRESSDARRFAHFSGLGADALRVVGPPIVALELLTLRFAF